MAKARNVLPCGKVIPCMIQVRVLRNDPSAGKGTVGKQLANVTIKLRDETDAKDLGTGTSKSGSKHLNFDNGLNIGHKYSVEADLGANAHFEFTGSKRKLKLDVPAFSDNPVDVGKVFTTLRYVAKVDLQVDRLKKRITYRLRLRIATKEEMSTHFFKDAADTKKGQIARLQVLGFFNRPLDYDYTIRTSYYTGIQDKEYTDGGKLSLKTNILDVYNEDQCLKTGALYYRRYYALKDDADISKTLDQHVVEFLVQSTESEKGMLPADDKFAKLRIPGGYNVYWPKGSREAEAAMFGSGGYSRFLAEQRFFKANPWMGRIPLVAEVDRKEGGGDWQLLKDVADKDYEEVDVVFRLLTPAKVPAKNYAAAPDPRLGTLASLDNKTGKVMTAAKKGNSGPAFYLEQRVTKYLPGDDTDPQKDNVHWHLGGKRGIADDGDLTKDGGTVRKALFPLDTVPHSDKYSAPTAGASDDYKHSVAAKAGRDGRAFVMFSPSSIGGDRYKIQAEIGPDAVARDGDDAKALVKSGTLVVWRNVRVLHHIRVVPPAAKGEMEPTIATDLKTEKWTCKHNAHVTGRICFDCLTRESLEAGKLDWVDFAKEGKLEFSKAYCELDLDPSIAGKKYETMGDDVIKAAMDRALEVIQGDKQANRFDNSTESPLPFVMADGILKDFEVRKVATCFAEGSVRISAMPPDSKDDGSWQFVGLHNSATDTVGAPPPILADQSSYDQVSRILTVKFSTKLDPSWDIKLVITGTGGEVTTVTVDTANLGGDGASFTQLLTQDFLPGSRITIKGLEVGGTEASSFNKTRTEIFGVPAATGPQAKTNGFIDTSQPGKISIKLLAPLAAGKEVKLYGNGDASDVGGYANGVVIYTGTDVQMDWVDFNCLEKCEKANTWLKVDGKIIAKTNEAGKFAGVEDGVIKLHASSAVATGKAAKLTLKFPQALDGSEKFILKGGGSNKDSVELFEFAFDGEVAKTEMTVSLPKDITRYKVQLMMNNVLLADDSLRLVARGPSAVLELESADVDCAAGTIHVVFTAAPAKGTFIGVNYICPENYVQLSKLFYSPQKDKKSPFLFHMHTPWVYNESRDAQYGPLPMTTVFSESIAGKKDKAQELNFQHFLRNNTLMLRIGKDLWSRPSSGMTGGASTDRTEKGREFDIKVAVAGGTTAKFESKENFKDAPTFDVAYQSVEVPSLEVKDYGKITDDKVQHAVPFGFVQWGGKLLPKILTEFFRQIHQNQSFIPGLIFVQASLYDTISCTYAGGAQVGLAQGPGSFLTGSRMFAKPDSYKFKPDSEDSTQSGNAAVIGVHEICHSLYFQHAVPAGGMYPQDHDTLDVCLMSYNNEIADFCGQCLASLEGMNYTDGRLVTATDKNKKIDYQGSDYWKDQPVNA
jgi:hypothetical protein